MNYNKKCGEIFKYKKNNEKDLVILAYDFLNKSSYHNLFMEISIDKILNTIQYSIPKAHIICFVTEKSMESKIIGMLVKNNIEIIKIQNSKEHITNRRFIESYNYLKKNKHLYERVLHMDFNDIYIFGDIFATIGENDLFINYECDLESKTLKNCKHFFNTCNKQWFEQNMNNNNTNKTEVNQFIKNNPLLLNAGVFIGGINNFFNFCKIISIQLLKFNNQNQMNNFGYDQILFNYLFYLGYFKQINLKPIGCEQRMCFRPKNLLFNNKTTIFIYNNSRCSPILVHKGYPNSWISLENNHLKNFSSM